MVSDETRLAMIEKDLLDLAKKVEDSKKRHDENDKWRTGHEIEHLTRHNEVIAMMTSIAVDVGIIKKERIKEETDADIKSKKRKDLFDRAMRIIMVVIGVAVFLSQVYNWIKGGLP